MIAFNKTGVLTLATLVMRNLEPKQQAIFFTRNCLYLYTITAYDQHQRSLKWTLAKLQRKQFLLPLLSLR